jgi:energy-coupling factor transporter ATP-binding protein EcfA2
MDETPESFPERDVTLIGVATDKPQGPVKPFWMNLEPGIAVIYGRNGSGKSHVLRTLAESDSRRDTSLFLKCVVPSDENPDHNLFWCQMNLTHLESRRGFHDDMYHFLNESDRYTFSKRVHLVSLRFLRGFLQAATENKHDPDFIPSTDTLLEQIDLTIELLQEGDKYWPSMKKLGDRILRILDMTATVAYKNELWIHPDEVGDNLITIVFLMMIRGQRFSIRNQELHLVEAAEAGTFREICVTEGIHGAEYIDLVEEFGYGIANLIDDWNEKEGTLFSPWDGPRLVTGVANPRWGRIIADVDLDQQHYGDKTNADFLNDIRTVIARIRSDLPRNDPRHLSYGDDTGYRPLLYSTDKGTSWDPGAIKLLEDVTSIANTFFSSFLQDAPILECTPNAINDWPDLPPISWNVVTPTGEKLPISKLSWAEQRWASMAIRLATPAPDFPLQLIVIDEPERGLHRQAERTLANALRELSASENITCVVATHSPTFLGLHNARLHHISKSTDGTSTMDALPIEIETWANELGLNKTDLLQLCRLFLIVEGEHDAIILNTLFRDEFAQHGVQVIPLRGLRNITNATDGSFIFRFTDASVLYLTDNDNHQRVSNIWKRALAAQPDQQLDIVAEFASHRETAEGQLLKDFTALALNFAARHRIDFASLPAEDILDYLPVQAFVPKATSWEQLRKQWGRPKNGNFKKWLNNTHGSVIDNGTITNAVESLDAIPHDLVELLQVILRVATNQPARTI